MSRANAMRYMSGNGLVTLAKDIEKEHQAAREAARTAIEHAIRCGELLLKAKPKVQHGEWLPWLAANTSIGTRQAQNYMRIAANKAEIEQANAQRDSHLPVREAIALLAEPKPELQERVTRINEKFAQSADIRREFVRCLHEMRATFDDDAAFKAWLIKNPNVPIGDAFVEKIPDLLSQDYDDDAWIVAMLDDILAELEVRP